MQQRGSDSNCDRRAAILAGAKNMHSLLLFSNAGCFKSLAWVQRLYILKVKEGVAEILKGKASDMINIYLQNPTHQTDIKETVVLLHKKTMIN